MIDARRMEVYTATYTAEGERLTEVAPVIVDNVFSDSLSGVLFIGDGVEKCKEVLSGDGRWFRQECPMAEAMAGPALREWNAKAFRDTAYFEPFYLKDFIATTPKKLF